ncbi:heterokaryon incompatibility [Fusarium longipes]|uniref:Heterokaryon incompatibility n=1 Tax=Fusarium longipes TaxID=694270 RepID=A0A395SI16_9HYPO|nr:heterokaryon incompatibility [Fusarium longipes]
MQETTDISREMLERFAGCRTCCAIWQRLTSEQPVEGTFSVGSFDEALSTDCPRHKPLLQAFYDYTGYKDEDGYENSTSKDVGFWSGGDGHHVHLTESVSSLGMCWSVALIKDSSVPNHPGTVRVLDPDWADLDVLNRWKDACISSHGAICHNPLKVWHVRPAWLIDVQRECLVPGSVEGNYLALSYTYGDRIGRLIDATVRERLQVSHALRDPSLSEYIPAILSRAVYLTSTLRERYLWVDAICIPHEKESATEQLRLMGAIYANAIATIIAADGDSLTGLNGLKGVSQPRQLEQEVVPFGDEKLLRRDNFTVESEVWRPYYERGWIFQELRLSPRKIIFHDNKIHWKCQCTTWFEESTPSVKAELRPGIDRQFQVFLAGYFDWGIYSLLLTHYNNLTLRYDQDALPAISGYLSVASRVFKGGFLYGIPEIIFERGLGWKPVFPHLNLQRRIRSTRPHGTQLTPSDLPSWSWIGWKGPVHPGYDEATRVATSECIEESTPITKWYTSRSPKDPPDQWRSINSTWYEDRDSYKDFTRPLPPGWTRHNAPDEAPGHNNGPHLYPDGCDKYVFQHESMPDDEISTRSSRNWYYPFPILGVNEATQPEMPEQTEYLFCKTSKAQVFGFRKNEWNDVTLHNVHNERIGFLNLVNVDFSSRYPEPLAEDRSGTGLPVDLVAVCKIRTYAKTWNESKKFYDNPVSRKDTYLVLWVEWEDGIAYRLASGQVAVEEWDRLDLQTIDLILG